MSNFVEDFSVTTNGLRTPKRALEVAAAALRPTDVQYKEYERSAANNGLQLQDHKQAELVCAVNPCNPTEDWVNKLYETRGIKVFVIHSWTKIWACPWSLNTLAIAFLSEVVKDYDYMSETWKLTPRWSDAFRKTLQGIRPEWDIKGRNTVSIRWPEFWPFTPSGAVRCVLQAAIVVDALRTPLSSP
uniref:Aminotransferase, class I/II superfamily protein n=1 Tax=Toxoplasma gondii (strain ATCC 50861 / VEG) TaxID=432359 RepID=A0A0F7VBE6_TOXGV|nr:TPA: aminotransferase, class I/II superfamily protein [Toxoplasma gondii VEG]